MPTSKSATVLVRFTRYCQEHPEQRFWQALRNWSGWGFIVATNKPPVDISYHDTFYWKGSRRPRIKPLPCPFCGTVPKVLKADYMSTRFYCQCLAATRCKVVPTTPLYHSEYEAIAAWNRRANSD
ncbi:MAG: Lar family restriction alleviation protein [Patescibacteria group bacterium]|nr:Lar family restriction alleviation protein [Patescibacteria group bacterium]